jgi:small subunit ribosomal protein S6
MKGNKNLYEVVLVIDARTDDKEKEEVLGKITGWLEGVAGKVTKKDHVGGKALAYKIKGQDKGDFWMLEVEGEKPLKLKEVSLSLNRETKIIRYLILKRR